MTDRSFDAGAFARAAADTLTVRRVFGEPYEHEGRLVVPVARAAGRAGLGAGGSAAGAPAQASGDGGGGGWATRVRPLGVVVVDRDGVRWSPTVDVNRAILGGQLVAAVVGTAWALAWAVRRRR